MTILQKDDVIQDISSRVILYASSQTTKLERIELLYNVEAEQKVLYHVTIDGKSKYSGTVLQKALDIFTSYAI